MKAAKSNPELILRLIVLLNFLALTCNWSILVYIHVIVEQTFFAS